MKKIFKIMKFSDFMWLFIMVTLFLGITFGII